MFFIDPSRRTICMLFSSAAGVHIALFVLPPLRRTSSVPYIPLHFPPSITHTTRTSDVGKGRHRPADVSTLSNSCYSRICTSNRGRGARRLCASAHATYTRDREPKSRPSRGRRSGKATSDKQLEKITKDLRKKSVGDARDFYWSGGCASSATCNQPPRQPHHTSPESRRHIPHISHISSLISPTPRR